MVPNIANEASGWWYSVPRMCQSLASRGHDVELSCLYGRHGIDGVTTREFAVLPVLRKFGISIGHTCAMMAAARRVDLVHNHSLWSLMNMLAGWVVPGHRAKLVVSPHGTLSAAALSRRRSLKNALWPLQYRTLAKADLLHATSAAEYRDIRSIGLGNPVAIIPNGIDVPRLPPTAATQETRTLLFLSRIHPHKGLDRLLTCWQRLQDRHPHWQLVVAGKGDSGYEKKIKAMANGLRLRRVRFVGPVYGSAKSRLYTQSQLFALPTDSENFGMVVAEALAHSCPCVVTTGAPWEGLETEGCGWWVERDVCALADALHTAMSRSEDTLRRMGRIGRDWMIREYGWDAIGRQLDTAYRWLLGQAMKPVCVETA
ncbi:MAG: glycosyltransferase [Spirochaetaceae bacterium]|nr:glycosyltransferase [Spirochaetaceae bacterium]